MLRWFNVHNYDKTDLVQIKQTQFLKQILIDLKSDIWLY